MSDPTVSDLAAARARVEQIEQAEENMAADIASAVPTTAPPQRPWGAPKQKQKPSELLKAISDKIFHRLAECEKISDQLEKKREFNKSVVQLRLEQKQSGVSVEMDRINVEINKLNDQLAEQKALCVENDQLASSSLEGIDAIFDKELEANATIKKQMIAALAAGAKLDPDFLEVEAAS